MNNTKNSKKRILILSFLVMAFLILVIPGAHAEVNKQCMDEYKRAWESVSLGEKGKELANAQAVDKQSFSYRKGAKFGGVCKNFWDKKQKTESADANIGRFISSGKQDPNNLNRVQGYYQDPADNNWYWTTKSTESLTKDGKVIEDSTLIDTVRKTQVGFSSDCVFFPQKGYQDILKTASPDKDGYVAVSDCRQTNGNPIDGVCYIDSTGRIFQKNQDGTYEHHKETMTSQGGGCLSTGTDVPYQMQYGINPEGQYVLDPKSGLTQSFKAVCLPATTAYLKQYRTIADAIRRCVKTIRVTGEGNAGVCQSIISQYVCDFVLDQVLCKSTDTKAGKTRKSATKQNDFLSILSGQAASTETGIGRRYGESNMFKAMFSERKLINSMCLKAFSGDWGIDLDTMLSEDYAMAIESEGFVNPATRRFVSANPINGKVAFQYHIGTGLIAGSDLEFEVKLICSNDDSCVGEDYPERHCDCFGQSAPMEKTLVSGNLMNGDLLAEDERSDIYYVVEDTETQSVRYDKVVLMWRDDNKCKGWGNPDCMIVKPIKSIGQRPPLECGFDREFSDPPQYKCEYEASRFGDAWLSQELMDMTKHERPKTYYLDDTIRLGLSEDDKMYAFVKMPRDKKYPVYYYWKIVNTDSMIVEEEEELLETDGKNELKGPNWKFTKDAALDFSGETSKQTTTSCQMQTSELSLKETNFKCDREFILTYTAANTAQPFSSDVHGICDFNKGTLTVTCGTGDKKTEFYLSKLPGTSVKTIRAQVKMFSVTQESKNLLTSNLCPEDRDATWTLEFGLYKPNMDETTGRFTNDRSDTPYSHEGVSQKGAIKFKIRCSANPGKKGDTIELLGKDEKGDDKALGTGYEGQLPYTPARLSDLIKQIKVNNPDASKIQVEITTSTSAVVTKDQT